MRIAVGADHGGFALKGVVAEHLRAQGHEVVDVGAHEFVPADDYPDFAVALAQVVRSGGAERGVLICGSGVGACVAVNKVPGIRGSLAHDCYSAHQGVEHDDANVLCLGARVVGEALAVELVEAFVAARFSGEARHARRLAKVKAIEARFACPEEQGER